MPSINVQTTLKVARKASNSRHSSSNHDEDDVTLWRADVQALLDDLARERDEAGHPVRPTVAREPEADRPAPRRAVTFDFAAELEADRPRIAAANALFFARQRKAARTEAADRQRRAETAAHAPDRPATPTRFRQGRPSEGPARGRPLAQGQEAEGREAGQAQERGPTPPYMCPATGDESDQNTATRPGEAENVGGTKRKNANGHRPAPGGQTETRAYIQTRAKVPTAAAAYVDSLLRDYDDVTAHFFKHVLNSGCLWGYEDRRVAVPSALVKRKLRDRTDGRDAWPDVAALVLAGLMDEPTPYRVGKRSKGYRVTDPVQAEYDRLTATNLEGPYVNLYTGKRDRSYVKSETRDDDGRAVPSLVRTAMRAIKCNGVANFDAAHEQLQREREEARRLRDNEVVALAQHGPGPEHDEAESRAVEAEGRYRNDLHCLRAIKANQSAEIGGGFIRYRVPYKMTSTGRLAFIGGGAQSCSKGVKAALYDGVGDAVGRPLHNYDIRSSQPTVLREKLTEADLPTGWIDTYTASDKADYARRAGLTVSTWKGVLCAVMMGAMLPGVAQAEGSPGDVCKAVRAEVGPGAFLTTYNATRGVLGPLYGVLQDWHTYLTTDWLRAEGYRDRGREYVKNPTGARFCVSDHTGAGKPPHKLRRKLAAFVLQGQESYFIHTLTALGERYGFDVVANEHDGLVTLGEIPAAAIREARATCAMPYVELVEKPFL